MRDRKLKKQVKMKPMFRGTIVVDIDGVLADFEGEFCDRFGQDNRHEQNLYKRYPKYEQLIDDFISNPETYKDLTPIFGGRCLVEQAKMRGYRVELVSSRPESSSDATREWLNRYNIHYDKFVVGVKSKAQYIRSYCENPILLVDDIPDNLIRIEGIGVNGILWSQPWNYGWDVRRMTYSSNKMRLLVFDTVSKLWMDFWTGKVESF